MRFYFAPGSCALAVHIALEEAGLPYVAIPVRLESNEQRSPEFLAMNPLGRVPVLVTTHGPMTEVPALLTYVAACAPKAGLVPCEPFSMAHVNSSLAFFSSTVHPTFAHIKRPYRWVGDSECQQRISAKAVISYADMFDLIESHWLRGPWILGESYTIADSYLYVLARWLERAGIDSARFRRVAAHCASMERRPAVQRALEQEGLGTLRGRASAG